MKAIIMICCYNEADTLPDVLNDLPSALPGADKLEVLVVDDGSTDNTSAIAADMNVDHIKRFSTNRGLATAYSAGLQEALRLGADVIISTDGDHQYRGRDIPVVAAPVLSGEADLVVGERPIEQIASFSRTKKWLQRIGSRLVSRIARINVPDVTSGLRAFNREAALSINRFSTYSLSLESLLQLGLSGKQITSVPIGVNPPRRPSRLMRSTGQYVFRQAMTIIHIYLTYRPAPFFLLPASLSMLAGVALGLRFLWFYSIGEGEGHIQSLILTAVLLLAGGLLFAIGTLAHLIAVNRRIAEDTQRRIRRLEMER